MTFPDAIELVKVRVDSVLAMTASIFMKRIRQLQFNNLMDEDSRSKLVVFNLIYSLNPIKDRQWLWELDPELKPTSEMIKLSKDAERVATTLWINEKELENLVDCGRATTCFALLKHLWQKWQAENSEAQKQNPSASLLRPDMAQSPYYEIYTTLKKKWVQLNHLSVKPPDRTDVFEENVGREG
jgi:hypothetical protein